MVDRQNRLSSLFDSFTEADDYQSSITDDAIYTDSGISEIADQLQVENKIVNPDAASMTKLVKPFAMIFCKKEDEILLM